LSKDLVSEFVSSYTREFDFYREAARLCSDRCERSLAERGIKAIVSHRAKRPNNLLTKLLKRDAQKNYMTLAEIRRDIPDLAGVRIALYFPGDRDRVRVIVSERFCVTDQKTFPRDGKRRPGKRFDGYCADHYRVELFEIALDEEKKQYSNAIIEIQVGSVLMHGWSEVEHDLVYKPESGELSEDEHAILDELNGMVIAGEIALERLQRAVERRLGQDNARFESHYDLAVFLHKWLRGTSLTSEPPMGRIDILWELLRKANLTDASDLGHFLQEHVSISEEIPLSDQISDSILEQKPELYKSYVDIQTASAIFDDWSLNSGPTANRAEAFGNFLSSWIILERAFYLIGSGLTPSPTSSDINVRDMPRIAQEIGLAPEAIATLMQVRMTRNQLVHGANIPSSVSLRESTSELNVILRSLSVHPDAKVRAAYEDARRPLGE
jgi:ppGpp synthetase/RelA/SpoT-type nucleotidyltranferase